MAWPVVAWIAASTLGTAVALTAKDVPARARQWWNSRGSPQLPARAVQPAEVVVFAKPAVETVRQVLPDPDAPNKFGVKPSDIAAEVAALRANMNRGIVPPHLVPDPGPSPAPAPPPPGVPENTRGGLSKMLEDVRKKAPPEAESFESFEAVRPAVVPLEKYGGGLKAPSDFY